LVTALREEIIKARQKFIVLEKPRLNFFEAVRVAKVHDGNDQIMRPT
jgi:hypothetical protein